MKKIMLVLFVTFLLFGCVTSPDGKDAEAVEAQQSQYSKSQPIPMFDYSLERALAIELYKLRNKASVTHSVWRSDYGIIEGDCPSYGYGIPYDTSLTNPLKIERRSTVAGRAMGVIEQPEPNGLYASKNTTATWVMCLSESGGIEPVYVESKVTVYPGPVIVDYEHNRVRRSGAATVLIPKARGAGEVGTVPRQKKK